MILEDIEHQTGQDQQGQDRQQPPPDRESAGRPGLIVVRHREDAPFHKRQVKYGRNQYTTIGRESLALSHSFFIKGGSSIKIQPGEKEEFHPSCKTQKI